jgi:hypothetical protein
MAAVADGFFGTVAAICADLTDGGSGAAGESDAILSAVPAGDFLLSYYVERGGVVRLLVWSFW